MKAKQMFKIILDIMMTILFMVMMAYHITGNTLHEWLGITLFVLFMIHNALNYKWYKSLFKGRYSSVRVLGTVINLLLILAMLGIIISGVMLSRDVFAFLNLSAGMFGRRLHMLSTSWAYLLMAAHLGMHWSMISGMISSKAKKKDTKVLGILSTIVTVIISAYGVYAFVTRQVAEKLFLLMEYAFFDYSEPSVFFFADYFTIMVLFAAITYYLSKLLKNTKSKRSNKK